MYIWNVVLSRSLISFLHFSNLPAYMSNNFFEPWIFPDDDNYMHVRVLGAILLMEVGSLLASTYAPKTCLRCFWHPFNAWLRFFTRGLFLGDALGWWKMHWNTSQQNISYVPQSACVEPGNVYLKWNFCHVSWFCKWSFKFSNMFSSSSSVDFNETQVVCDLLEYHVN